MLRQARLGVGVLLVAGWAACGGERGVAPDGGPRDGGEVRPAARIGAAVAWPGTRAYVFLGTEYIRYDLAANSADPGDPRPIDGAWPGLWAADVDAGAALGDTAYFFRGDQVARYGITADATEPGYPRAITELWPDGFASNIDAAFADAGSLVLFQGPRWQRIEPGSGAVIAAGDIAAAWPGVWPDGVDAALRGPGDAVYLFRGDDYLRFDLSANRVDDGHPRPISWYWPGLFDPDEGSGHPGPRLPPEVAALLVDSPDAQEIAARRARCQASITGTEVDLTPVYPEYLASIEARLGTYGCCIVRSDPGADVYRLRCATDTAGPAALAIVPPAIDSIDWRIAAYHTAQVSQGDFSADAGTPLSIFTADDGVFYVESVTGNRATGSISGGLHVRVRFLAGGVSHAIGFSHLNGVVPAAALDAAASGAPLPVGTVFGFIGYTGNLWMAAPPAVDGPYTGSGAGLPVAHSHLWFVDDLANHQALTPQMRQTIDYSGTYFFGGG